MRFATFVAFTLPLAALAAPTPLPRQVFTTFTEFDQAFSQTDSALKATISQLSGSQILNDADKQQEFLEGFQKADTYLGVAHYAAVYINYHADAHLRIQKIFGSAYTEGAQSLITKYRTEVDDSISDDPPSSQDASKSLQSNIDAAFNGIEAVYRAGLDLFQLYKTDD